ncbi:lateral flagellar motor switch protein LfiM [Aeromonas dhakensis]|uniref:FliM/FliN family flagellar motor C-terminal domain-containing protein n=1 Tax=Aeromonas dhakensis TaxID=196024 RepID=UPI001AAE3E06|nr:flagellar motor switch protein FliM [Aeromonas dhakensis]MBO2901588.1 lateral flagellar motor switch protein LfiM [Aeromonas dhakensis]MBO2996727.1 lateral flagellar motor switch protein LfiM [Aeromonas dhakensis]
MSSSGVMLTPSRLLCAQRGKTLPHYDLLGVERADQERLKQINAQLGTFSLQAAGCMAQLFSSADCELSYQEFTTVASPVQDDGLLWVEARSALDVQRVAYFSISPAVIYRLAVLFFGGALRDQSEAPSHGKGLTDTEQRLMLRLCQYQVDIWSSCLGLGDLGWQLTLITRDALPQSRLWMSEASLTVGSFAHGWQLWLVPPTENSGPAAGHELQDGALELVLTHVPVRLRVVMGQMSMTLADLECLKVGDVLSLDLPEVVPALIGNRPCFSGRVAEHKGSLVYQVATVVEE